MHLFSPRVPPSLGDIANCCFWMGKSVTQAYAGSGVTTVVSFDVPFWPDDPTSLGCKHWDAEDNCFVIPKSGVWAFGGAVVGNTGNVGNKIVQVSFRRNGESSWGETAQIQNYRCRIDDLGTVGLGAAMELEYGDRVRLEHSNSYTTGFSIIAAGAQFFGVKVG